MCGILAYMGHKPLPIAKVLEALHILESEQQQDEKSPVGGHGAGIALLNERDEFTLEKVGKTKGSPVDDLRLQLKETESNSSLILGHVRRASPEFKNTIPHRECTQPYKPHCTHNLNLATAHNGFLQNYQQLKNKLNKPHHFESQKIKLIDSEVIAHLFEESLSEPKDARKATHTLFEQIQGSNTKGNTVATLCYNKSEAYMSAIQKGKTRGLVVWTNPKHDVLICSREQPAEKIFHRFLTENKFQKIIKVSRRDSINLEAHFSLNLLQ